MKALSIYQGWASALFASRTIVGDAVRLKTIETRGWPTRYRGPLLICAAARWDRWCRMQVECVQAETYAGWSDPFRDLVVVAGVRLAAVHPRDQLGHRTRWVLPIGAALGVVDLVDCVPAESMYGQIPEWEWSMGDYSPGRFAWITERPRRLPLPLPVRGRQGLFTPDQALCIAAARAVEMP